MELKIQQRITHPYKNEPAIWNLKVKTWQNLTSQSIR